MAEMRPGGTFGPEPLEAMDPTTVGPYRLLGRLGAGGMGQVYLGRSAGGRMVALKMVRADLAREPEFRRRFQAEVEAARRVGGLWTAPVLESDTESAVPWVATGYVAGPSLKDVVDRLHGPLPETSVWALAFGLSLALRDIHGKGLVHRDLKPSNVMVTLEGPKVIDFGIARALDASVVTRTGTIVGTPGYMPPEQIRGERLTATTDVFALGAVLACAATGRAPFNWDGAAQHAVHYRVIHEEPRLGPVEGPLTGELRALVARCLDKDVTRRPTLAEIEPLAEARSGEEFWLPASLTARVGQDAAALLEFDAPAAEPAAWWSPHSPGTPPPAPYQGAPSPPPPGRPPTASHASTIPPSPDSLQAAGPPRRRRGLLAALAGVAALAIAVPLVIMATSDDGDGGAGGAGAEATVEPGEATRDDAGADGGGAPLADLVPAELRQAGELTVWVAERHDPILFEEGGELVGFEVDLAREIGQRFGVDIDFAQVDGSGRVAVEGALRNGGESPGHIAMSGFSDNAGERDRLGVDFVNHFAEGDAVMSDDPNRSGAKSELCGLTVATWDDGESEDDIRDDTEECDEPIDVLLFDSRHDMAAAITEGDADVAVLLYSLAARFIQENPDAGMTVRLDSGEKGFRGIAVPPTQPELRDALAEAVDLLIEDGTYAELLARWGIEQAGLDSASVNGGR